MEEQLEKIEKGSFARAEKYVSAGFVLYKTAFEKLIGRNFTRFFDFFTLGNALLLIKLKTYIRHSRYTARFFRSAHLQMAYTFQNIYVGQSPFSSPALFSMIPSAELTEGSLFPTGGMYSLTARLMEVAEEHGVRFHFSKPVSRITVEGKKATGVVFSEGGEAKADVVVANADLPYVYRKLLPPGRKSRRLDSLKYSCSALVIHWGLDKQIQSSWFISFFIRHKPSARFTPEGNHDIFSPAYSVK